VAWQGVQRRRIRVCATQMRRAVDWQRNHLPSRQQESLRDTIQLFQQVSGVCIVVCRRRKLGCFIIMILADVNNLLSRQSGICILELIYSQ